MLPVTPTSAEESRRPKLFRPKGFRGSAFLCDRRKWAWRGVRRALGADRNDVVKRGPRPPLAPLDPEQIPPSVDRMKTRGAGFSTPRNGALHRVSETDFIDPSRPHLVDGRNGAHPHRVHPVPRVAQLARHAHQRSRGCGVGDRMGLEPARSSAGCRLGARHFRLRVGAFRGASLRGVRRSLNGGRCVGARTRT